MMLISSEFFKNFHEGVSKHEVYLNINLFSSGHQVKIYGALTTFSYLLGNLESLAITFYYLQDLVH